ncbi:amidohydrolase family protein [uncultured Methanospirillum sp.]|uniref:amidohydrolase n=1 Tax=uncultured Methanospirillum sp. TaxID=262503 RepID=UPI0029C8849D|nr:amidohydrolase family protein [uncultured Methanospirillum sp.]
MSKPSPLHIILLILFAAISCSTLPVYADQYADTVLLNGSVYTVEPGTNWSENPREAVAIKGDTILSVNSSSDITKYIGPKTNVHDLAGMMVLPGFIDSHIHFGASAELTFGVNLSACHSVSEVQQLLSNYYSEHPDIDVIRGFGWNYYIFNQTGPDKAFIDTVIPDKPVILISFDGHATWVNSKALEVGEITADTPDPEGGKIEHDANGDSSGVLREMAASNLVTSKVPPLTPSDIEEKVMDVLPKAAAYGITTADDAALTPGMILAYSHLESQGKLPVRIFGEMVAVPNFGTEQIALMELEQDIFSSYPSDNETSQNNDITLNTRLANTSDHQLKSIQNLKDTKGLFRLETGKLFLDGVVEGHTGYLLSPYTDQPETKGMINWNVSRFDEMIRTLDREGFQVDIHSIGDGAVRLCLDAYENARDENGKRDSRHKISHIQLINSSDIPRLKSLGIVASLQPNWFYYDNNFRNVSLPYLGSDRAEHMYTLKTLLDNDIPVAFGSDWPVGTDYLTFNPLDGIRTAVTRLPLPPDSPYKKPYRPEERIDLQHAIESYTYTGAYTDFMENSIGSIEPGKLADIIVIDKDLFTIQPEDINKAHVVATYLEGKQVYSDLLVTNTTEN